ncbi:M56 family metallopeptidase [Rhodanobacter ginsengisoli]|uniref:M56 family metallopeptidase n=1 Tax=Rhodanobacter ginsengisoli TaxID=418646 RepID=A0ABW0QQJ0_9GAMM
MNSPDPFDIDWLGHGWLMLLAFTVGVLLVLALRRSCRRLFGAERACTLWLLPPLAMLASQLPHVAATQLGAMPTVVYAVTSATAALPVPDAAGSSPGWRLVVLMCWLAGAAISMALAAWLQWRYRRRLQGATLISDVGARWPVLRATSPQVGPALVGAWRARIVLPSDFALRYDSTEQALILAHETMHACRRDGWWCLLGQIVAGMFWFHPLAWWALAALRHDQELACDAAVLREHGARRRSYANAMLKTQSAAFALPVGCLWSPRHPITERIAMLKLRQPTPARQRSGAAFMALSVTLVAGAVYASTPSSPAQGGKGTSGQYTLKIDVTMGGHPDAMHFIRCVKSGEPARVSGTDGDKLSWLGSFSVSPVADGQLEIRTQIGTRFDRGAGKVRTMSGKPVVRTLPGLQAAIVFGQVIEGSRLDNSRLEDNTIKLGITPTPGCAGIPLADIGDAPAAASSPVAVAAPATREYQLNMAIELATDEGRSTNVRRATLTLCTTAGKTSSFKINDWMVDATAEPAPDRRMQVDLAIYDAGHALLARKRLSGAFSKILHADGGTLDGRSRYVMDVTPLEGCPARAAEAAGKTGRA